MGIKKEEKEKEKKKKKEEKKEKDGMQGNKKSPVEHCLRAIKIFSK